MAEISGTDHLDSLTGTAENDVIEGRGGSDTIFGGDGDDQLIGEYQTTTSGGQKPKGDELSGGAGNDTLLAAEGDDVLDGGAGMDALIGGEGADTFKFSFTTASAGQSESFTEWLKANGSGTAVSNGELADGMTQAFFSTKYTEWLQHLVKDFGLGVDKNGDGRIKVGLNQKDPDGTPKIEGLSKAERGEMFSDRESVLVKTGKSAHDKNGRNKRDDDDDNGHRGHDKTGKNKRDDDDESGHHGHHKTAKNKRDDDDSGHRGHDKTGKKKHDDDDESGHRGHDNKHGKSKHDDDSGDRGHDKTGKNKHDDDESGHRGHDKSCKTTHERYYSDTFTSSTGGEAMPAGLDGQDVIFDFQWGSDKLSFSGLGAGFTLDQFKTFFEVTLTDYDGNGQLDSTVLAIADGNWSATLWGITDAHSEADFYGQITFG